MSRESTDFDVLIAGGGMVGASLTRALSMLPLRIALVEATPFDSTAQPSFDARTTALSRSSQRILDGLGIWSDIGADATGIRRIHISERGRFGTAVIDAAEQGVGMLGHVVENRRLGRALWAEIGTAANVDVFCPARIARVATEPDRVTLALANGHGEVTSRLLVAADGARSEIREMLGIDAETIEYGQVAIVAAVECSGPTDGATAYERFTANGPLALLPAGGGRFVVVLTRRTDVAPEVLALDDASLLDLLQGLFGSRLGRFERIGSRASYPLALVRARAVTAPRAVLIGNAAHGLHPVAGQGYNLGLRDVATLAEIIANAQLEHGSITDPGADSCLSHYRAWRQRDQRNVVAFTDGLVRFFGLPLESLGVLRGIGLLAFDVLPGAKSLLARHTMGLDGRLTRLARGLPL